MSDDTSKRWGQDRSRIAMGQEHDVRYWTEKFGVSKERLEEAVNKVGNSTDKVREYLAAPK